MLGVLEDEVMEELDLLQRESTETEWLFEERFYHNDCGGTCSGDCTAFCAFTCYALCAVACGGACSGVAS